jgi:hypothetical protein
VVAGRLLEHEIDGSPGSGEYGRVEGLRHRALQRDGMAIDEYYMGKLLPGQDGT